jgi:hypothetical protein
MKDYARNKLRGWNLAAAARPRLLSSWAALPIAR